MFSQNIIISISLAVISLFYFSHAERLKYPDAKRLDDVVDDYFGNKIADPYRWLEDANSEETKKYVQEQDKLSNDYINSFPQRKEIRENLMQLWNYSHSSLPRKAANKYFFFKNSGLQNHSVLHVKDTDVGEERVLLDPNSLAADGSISVATSDVYPSNDGEILCYGLSRGGSDWITLHFKNVTSGQDLTDVLVDTKFTEVLWTPDSKAIIYGHYPHQEKEDGSETFVTQNQKLYYHKLGTSQSEDVLVAEFPENPKLIVGHANHITTDGKYLILSPVEGAGANLLYYADIEEALKTEFKGTKLQIKPLYTRQNASYLFLGNRGTELYFLTNKNASNHQIVSIDLKNLQEGVEPEDDDWKTVIAERENVLDWASITNNYLKDIKSTIELRNLDTGSLIKSIPLEIGSVFEHYGKVQDSEFFYKFKSYLTPGSTYRVDLKNELLEPKLDTKEVLTGFNESEFVLKQVFYSSKDGTKIPMYIIHKKDLDLQGNSPCWLRGHGGFGESFVPDFAVPFIYFIKHFNGVLAVPNIRGGGEYGQKWHDGGRLHNKQNSFDDFAAAAEYLIKEKYTEPSKLVIDGQSNGGLLIAASINQRPELFGAAIALNPLTDMIRFQNFTTSYFACLEYGCSDDKEHLQTLIKYSPLHNVKFPEGSQYPSVLLVAGDQDDRIVPMHSYKLMAELQHKVGQNEKQTKPILLKIEHNAGHGDKKTTAIKIDEWADVFSFISKSLNINIV